MYFRDLGHRMGAVSHGGRSITYFRTAVLEKERVEPAILRGKDDEAQRRNGPKTVMQSRRRKRRIGFVTTRPVMLVISSCIESLTKFS